MNRYFTELLVPSDHYGDLQSPRVLGVVEVAIGLGAYAAANQLDIRFLVEATLN